MRALAVCSAVLSLLASAAAAASDTSRVVLPATFKPPQVFKNANLVHIISVEKNYVKETINVQIENIAKKDQDEYFLPFSRCELSRLGGVEVKDRKNSNAGEFTVQHVEYDPKR
jgi:oligosaccharyltransferase complex subunit alpha (ribophorin I)